MISKVTRNANFHRIAQYIAGKPSAEILLENVPEGNTVEQKAAAMQFVAARNHRVKRPAYHLSLSPAESDNLSRGDWLLLCNQVLDELGFQDNQVVVGLHHDVKYPNSEKTRTHAHLLINLVNDAGKCTNTSWDYYKIPKVLRHLERCYGLQAVPDVGEVGKHLDSAGQYRAENRSATQQTNSNSVPHNSVPRSVRRQLQDMIDEILKRCGSFEELAHALQSQGVEVNPTSQGWWVQYKGFPFAGYQLGRAYTKPSVLKRLEVELDEGRGQKADGRRENPSSTFYQEQESLKTNSLSDSTDENVQSLVKLMTSFDESENSYQKDEQVISSLAEAFNVTEEPEELELEKVPLVVSDSKSPTDLESTPDSESTGQQPEYSESSTSSAWINQLKQKAHQLESTELIDGKFYMGLAMDVTAHLGELVGEIRGDTSAAGLGDVTQPETSTAPNPEAVAESLSQFVQARAEAHNFSPDEPIATNLGTLHLDCSSDDKILTIARNITVAQWDEKSQEWQIDSDLAQQHQFSVSQLLNNEVVDVEGYRLAGDDSERVVTFEEVRFQAVEISGEWQVVENHLSESEQNRILKLPQSLEDYNRTTNGKDLVNYFQRHAPEQFDSDVGVINWMAENGDFDRRFEVSVQPDESVLIEGFDLKQTDDFGNFRQIFKAQIGTDHAIDCSQCDIPNRDIDQLLNPEILSQQTQQTSQRPERSR